MLKCVAISDGHSYLNPYLPKGDVLIMAGDMEPDGNPESQANWMHFSLRRWLNTVAKDFKYRIYTFGNHSWVSDEILRERNEKINGPYTELVNSLGIQILINERIDIEGYSFFVSPYCNKVGRWNWGLSGLEWDIVLDKWPKTDVLITHGPPCGIMDKAMRTITNSDGSYSRYTDHCGSMELYKWIEKNKIPLHIFGHFHQNWGQQIVEWESGGLTTFVNACQVNDNRIPHFRPIEIFLPDRNQ